MTRPADHGDGPKPLMRSLGEFVGHIWRGVKAPVGTDAKKSRVVRHETEEKIVDGASVGAGDAKVTLRRTTIEEIEVDRS